MTITTLIWDLLQLPPSSNILATKTFALHDTTAIQYSKDFIFYLQFLHSATSLFRKLVSRTPAHIFRISSIEVLCVPVIYRTCKVSWYPLNLRVYVKVLIGQYKDGTKNPIIATWVVTNFTIEAPYSSHIYGNCSKALELTSEHDG